MNFRAWKVVGATLVVVGIVVGLLELVYEPDRIVTEQSPVRPWWLPSLAGWFVSSAAAIIYIILDFSERRSAKPKHYILNAEPGKYEIKGAEITGTTTRSAESWQFFAFVFAAVATLALTLLDDLPDDVRLWRIAAKVVAFFGISYFTLVNNKARNALVRLLGVFKEERY